jgi:hypothetical protein
MVTLSSADLKILVGIPQFCNLLASQFSRIIIFLTSHGCFLHIFCPILFFSPFKKQNESLEWHTAIIPAT